MKIFTKFIAEKEIALVFENLMENMNEEHKVKFVNETIINLLNQSTEYLGKEEKFELLKTTINRIEKEKNEINKECTNPDYMCC